MFSRVIPSWEQIRHFHQPLTEGEICLLQFLDENLKKDDSFQGNDLTKYNGWLIFVQPYLNGSRPDIIIFNPYIGVQIFEVKDWRLDNYSFEHKGGSDKGSKVFCFSNRNGIYRKLSPVEQVQLSKVRLSYSMAIRRNLANHK